MPDISLTDMTAPGNSYGIGSSPNTGTATGQPTDSSGGTSSDPNNPDFVVNSVGDPNAAPFDTSVPLGPTDSSAGGGGTNPNNVDTSGGSSTPTYNSNSVASQFMQAIGAGNPSQAAMTAGALATAANAYNNAGQYTTDANQDAALANPFGQYRTQAGQSLMNLEANPSLVANTPGYQFAMNQLMDQTMSKMQASGLTGSTQLAQGEMNQASGLAQQTYNTTVANLMNQAGAQFSPTAAAQLLAQGQTNSMTARTAAMNALFAPLGLNQNQGSGTTINNNAGQPNSSNGGVSMPNINSAVGGGTSGANTPSTTDTGSGSIYNSTTGTYNPGFSNPGPLDPGYNSSTDPQAGTPDASLSMVPGTMPTIPTDGSSFSFDPNIFGGG